MLFYLIAIVAGVLGVCVLVVSAWQEPPSVEQPGPATGDGTPAKPLAVPPRSLEGVLAAQLVAGEITGGQYRRGIEGIAARDVERHPLVAPPEAGPADG